MSVNLPEDTGEIDLFELFLFLVRRWKLLLLVFALGGCIGAGVHFYFVTPSYKASAEIYITNSETVINYQDVQLSAALMSDYKEILLSRIVLNQVIRDQNLTVSYKNLKERISIVNPKDSHCLVISVTAKKPEEAVEITNSFVKYGVDQIYRTVGKNEPSVIDYAEMNAIEVIEPSLLKYGAVGAAAGTLLLCGLFTVQFLMDTTIKSEEDIEKYLCLDVLAVVPEGEHRKTTKRRKGKKKK